MRQNKLLLPILGLGVLILYLFSLPHTVTLEDSGAFMIAGQSLGIAHPPGYPLYTLISHLFSYLPFGTVAFRIPVFSAICGSLTCLLSYLIAFKITKHQTASLMAALFLALGNIFWWQSIIAEVYALHIFFFSAIFYLSLNLRERWSDKLWYLMVFIFGLSLTNHWPLIMLSSPAFLFLLFPQLKRSLRLTLKSTFIFSLGLIPYMYIFIRSKYEPAFTFFGSITDFDDFKNYILRSAYSQVDTSLTASFTDTLKYIFYFFQLLIEEHFYIGFALLCLGLVSAYKNIEKTLVLSLLFTILSTSVIFKIFFITDYNQHQADIFSAYQLAPMLASVIFIAIGIKELFALKRFKSERAQKYLLIVLSTFIFCGFIFHFKTNSKHNDTFASDYAKIVLQYLPTEHPLILWTDVDSNPIAYTQLVEKFRPNVQLYHRYGLLFSNRLFDPVKSSIETQATRLAEFINNNEPIYSIEDMALSERYNLPTEFNGLFVELARTPKPASTYSELAQAALKFLNDHPIDSYPRDWPYIRSHIRGKMCTVILKNGLTHPALTQDIQCRRAQARHLTSIKNLAEADRLFKKIIPDTKMLLPTEQVQVYHSYLNNSVLLLNNNQADGDNKPVTLQNIVHDVTPALEISRKCDNPVLAALLRLKEQTPIPLDINKTRQLFSHCPEILKSLAL